MFLLEYYSTKKKKPGSYLPYQWTEISAGMNAQNGANTMRIVVRHRIPVGKRQTLKGLKQIDKNKSKAANHRFSNIL